MWQVNEDEHTPIKIIKCHPGCLCCMCENESDDDNLKKQYSDTVKCIQVNGKCVEIKRVVYWEDTI